MAIEQLLNGLAGLSTEHLQAVGARVNEIMSQRLDTRPYPGRTAKYTWQGVVHRCRIVKVNQKTANVEEIAPSPGRRVRVSLPMLEVDPIERKGVTPVKPAQPHVPTTSEADHW